MIDITFQNRMEKKSITLPNLSTLYRDTMLVPINMGINMAARNQQKHLSLSLLHATCILIFIATKTRCYYAMNAKTGHFQSLFHILFLFQYSQLNGPYM